MLHGRSSQLPHRDARAGEEPPGQSAVDAHFDAHFAWWRSVYAARTTDGAIYRRRRDRVLSWVDALALPPGASVLEVGGGSGLLATELVRRGYEVLVVDSSEEMVANTRAEAAGADAGDRLTTGVADVHQLDLPDGAFSLVIAVGVLPWLHDPVRALREMARVAAPGAPIILTSDNESRLTHRLDPAQSAALRPARHAVRRPLARLGLVAPVAGPGLVRMYGRQRLEAMLSAAGLHAERLETVGFGPFRLGRRPIVPDAIGRRLDARLQRMADRGVASVRSGGSHHVVLAR